MTAEASGVGSTILGCALVLTLAAAERRIRRIAEESLPGRWRALLDLGALGREVLDLAWQAWHELAMGERAGLWRCCCWCLVGGLIVLHVMPRPLPGRLVALTGGHVVLLGAGLALGCCGAQRVAASFASLRGALVPLGSREVAGFWVALMLAFAAPVLREGSGDLALLAERQAAASIDVFPRWGAFATPLAFVLSLVAALALTSAPPFVAAVRPAALPHLATAVARTMMWWSAVVLFLGGSHLPGGDPGSTSETGRFAIVAAKVSILSLLGAFVSIGSVVLGARDRRALAWKVLVPSGLLQIGLIMASRG